MAAIGGGSWSAHPTATVHGFAWGVLRQAARDLELVALARWLAADGDSAAAGGVADDRAAVEGVEGDALASGAGKRRRVVGGGWHELEGALAAAREATVAAGQAAAGGRPRPEGVAVVRQPMGWRSEESEARVVAAARADEENELLDRLLHNW
jgi:hypothetical protein